jgi:outer membrane protein OmpA-like peptidoglycan-associated protein
LKKLFAIYLFVLSVPICGISQLKVDIYPTEKFMITQMLMGDSSTQIWNVLFKGTHSARGIFYSRNTVIPISEGLVLSTGNVVDISGPNKGAGFSSSNLSKGDQDLHFLAKYKTYDATWISFEFKATENLIRFNYIFGSEEYPEYVGSNFNDVFGFFLTDLETGEVTNLAVIPNTNKPITVNNINHQSHSNFFIPNATNKAQQIEFDGLTKPLIAYSEVVPNRKYRIKIAIADVGDDAFDSGVFLEGKSFKSENKKDFFINNSDYFEAFSNQKLVLVKTTEKNNVVPHQQVSLLDDKITFPIENTRNIIQDSVIIYFNFNKSIATEMELKNAKNKLDRLNIPNTNLIITGHTDQLGNGQYNQRLSVERATFINKWIRENFEIKTSTISGQSYNQLTQTQTTPIARAKNRRVVIRIQSEKP